MWLFALPLLVPALAGLAARPLAARLEPRQAVWLLTAASVALAACSTAALALAVAFAAVRSPVLAVAGDYSLLAVRRTDPVPPLAGLLAALLLTGAVVGVAAAIRRRAIAITRSYRQAATLTASDGIVVLPGPAVDAYALPGGPGRIVISGCLLDRLDQRRRDALVAHEHAHLTGRHYLFATAARLAAAANPLLQPAARAVDYALERWADEHAAAITGDRRLVAETIGQVALLASRRGPRPVAVAFGALGSRWHRLSVATAGPVPRRVAALLTAPPRRGAWVPAAAAAIVILTAVAAALAAVDLHALVEFGQAADQGLRG
jgi:beta-lactamase regulating signal transducer with metallopeptidase domain